MQNFEKPRDRKIELGEKIVRRRQDIQRVEELATKYPELVSRPNDTDLEGEDYRIWQEIHSLKMLRESLVENEAELEGLK